MGRERRRNGRQENLGRKTSEYWALAAFTSPIGVIQDDFIALCSCTSKYGYPVAQWQNNSNIPHFERRIPANCDAGVHLI